MAAPKCFSASEGVACRLGCVRIEHHHGRGILREQPPPATGQDGLSRVAPTPVAGGPAAGRESRPGPEALHPPHSSGYQSTRLAARRRGACSSRRTAAPGFTKPSPPGPPEQVTPGSHPAFGSSRGSSGPCEGPTGGPPPQEGKSRGPTRANPSKEGGAKPRA
jgi:hypothetical protein